MRLFNFSSMAILFLFVQSVILRAGEVTISIDGQEKKVPRKILKKIKVLDALIQDVNESYDDDKPNSVISLSKSSYLDWDSLDKIISLLESAELAVIEEATNDIIRREKAREMRDNYVAHNMVPPQEFAVSDAKLEEKIIGLLPQHLVGLERDKEVLRLINVANYLDVKPILSAAATFLGHIIICRYKDYSDESRFYSHSKVQSKLSKLQSKLQEIEKQLPKDIVGLFTKKMIELSSRYARFKIGFDFTDFAMEIFIEDDFIGMLASEDREISYKHPSTMGREFVKISRFGQTEFTIDYKELIRRESIGKMGDYVVAGSENGNIIVSSLINGKLIQKIKGHDAEIVRMRVSPDQTCFATASNDKKIKIWTIDPALKSGAPIVNLQSFDFKAEKGIEDFSISARCDFVLSLSWRKRVHLWSKKQSMPIRRMVGDDNPDLDFKSVEISPDGELLLTTISERIPQPAWRREIWAWTADGEKLFEKPSSDSVRISPDGTFIVAKTHDGMGCQILNKQGDVLHRLQSGGRQLLFPGRGNHLQISRQVWDIKTGILQKTLCEAAPLCPNQSYVLLESFELTGLFRKKIVFPLDFSLYLGAELSFQQAFLISRLIVDNKSVKEHKFTGQDMMVWQTFDKDIQARLKMIFERRVQK